MDDILFFMAFISIIHTQIQVWRAILGVDTLLWMVSYSRRLLAKKLFTWLVLACVALGKSSWYHFNPCYITSRMT